MPRIFIYLLLFIYFYYNRIELISHLFLYIRQYFPLTQVGDISYLVPLSSSTIIYTSEFPPSPARRATRHWAAEVSTASHKLAQLELLSDHSGRSERVLLALQAVNLAEVAGSRQLLADTYVTAALVFKDYMPKIGNWLCG